jgi:DNA-binding CsgD family transcriptional regulator
MTEFRPRRKNSEKASAGWGPTIRAMWKEGLTALEIKEKTGLSLAGVYYHLSHKNNPDTKIVRTCARGNMERVAKMTKQGLTSREIAAKLGIAVNTVHVHRHNAKQKGLLERKDYGQRQTGHENARIFRETGVRAGREGLEHPGRVSKPLWIR